MSRNSIASNKPHNMYANLYPVQIKKQELESFISVGGRNWIIGCRTPDNRRVFVADCQYLQSTLPLRARYKRDTGMYQFYLCTEKLQFATFRGNEVNYFGSVTECCDKSYQAMKRTWHVSLPHFKPSGYQNANINSVGKPADQYPEAGWLAILMDNLKITASLNRKWIVDTGINSTRRVYTIDAAALYTAMKKRINELSVVRGGRKSIYIDYKTGGLYINAAMEPDKFIITLEEYKEENFTHLITYSL